MTVTTDITLTDVIDFINRVGDEKVLAAVKNAATRRLENARQVRSMAITPGSKVQLDGLSPNYLNGLTGEVATVQGNRASVRLDSDSTNTLRFTKQKRFYIAADEETYVIAGVPRSTLQLID